MSKQINGIHVTENLEKENIPPKEFTLPSQESFINLVYYNFYKAEFPYYS